MPGRQGAASLDWHVPDVHGSRGPLRADPAQPNRRTTRVVVEPDAVAEQNRRDVQVNLVDEPQSEELPANRR